MYEHVSVLFSKFHGKYKLFLLLFVFHVYIRMTKFVDHLLLLYISTNVISDRVGLTVHVNVWSV